MFDRPELGEKCALVHIEFKSIKQQAEKLIHTSNLYKIGQQEKLAERLCEVSFADSVFFANSGAEANEGAVKIARRYMFEIGEVKRNKIVCEISYIYIPTNRDKRKN